ncbi:hypothetical protein KCG48_13580 [Proteiniclasticum sp. BAD-10]|uniref:Uncharacterized protein n=1 Tax=Proteiniclasticum sediminis TaxID=2804028 RepID=A0A941CRG0_9CLOT|nr:hypothetical protein [Proteiniclasticum sediminis]MBR0577342.1 hypothetical protein [Proteiniclasticum sediminis]
MISFLNRKPLMSDTSAEELARVKDVLKASGIPFEVKTTRTRGTIGTILDVKVYQTYNKFYKNADAHNGFIYTVHVRRSDYAKARKAVYGMA